MSRTLLAYVGNWKIDGFGYGLTICRFNPDTGVLSEESTVFPDISVGAVAVDDERGILYCTDERTNNPDIGPGGGGRVFAFEVDRETGALREMNRRSSHGSLASYVCVDRRREYLLVTNHSRETPITEVLRESTGAFRVVPRFDAATTVLYRLESDGSLGEACDVFQHPRANDGRQPHPHSVNQSPEGSVFIVGDKGTDRVVTFLIDREAHRLIPRVDAGLAAPRSAPRYAQFHPVAPFVFVNHEHLAGIDTYRYDDGGSLQHVASVDVLPTQAADTVASAEQSDLRLSASGRFLYTLIRNADVISVLAVDDRSGVLEVIQTLDVDGINPRGCALSPDGRFLLVACVQSQDVVTFAVGEDGRLTATGQRMQAIRPGTVTILP